MEVKLLVCLIFAILISLGICESVENSTISVTPTPTTLLDSEGQLGQLLGQGTELNSTTSGKSVLAKKDFGKKGFLKPNRGPKFGFNIPLISGSNIVESGTSSTPYPNYNPNYNNNNGLGGGGLGDGSGIGGNLGIAGLGVASTLALVKGGVLGGLTLLKAAVLPPLFIGAVIVFLVAGAAFFTCNVVNCGNLLNLGGSGGGIGSPFNNFRDFFNRNGYEPSSSYYGNGDYYYNYENQVQPVYQALEEAYKRYGGGVGGGLTGGGGDLKGN